MHHDRSRLHVLRLLALVLALGAFPVVNAQSTDRITAAEFGRLWGPALDPTGATQVRNYPLGPSYPVTSSPVVAAETGGGLSVSKTAKFPVDPTRVIDVTAKAQISKAAMGKALKGAFALAGGPLGVAFWALPQIAEWLTASGMSYDSTTQTLKGPVNDGLCHVVGGCQGYFTNSSTPATRLTALQACTASVVLPSGHTMEATGGNCIQRNSSGTIVYQFQYYYPTNMAYVAPSGQTTMTAADVEAYGALPTMKSTWLEPLLSSGASVDASLPTLTGPATAAGPTTSSTQQFKDASGVVTGTSTVNQSTTYNITYSGNTYNVNSTVTTTTVNPDGTSNVTTETKNKTPDKESATDCDKFPASAGCAELGTATPDVLKQVSKPFTVTAVAFASSSACPAPLSFTVRGLSYSVSYQPLCDRLALLKTLFLAIAGVIAAWIVADSFKVAS